MERMRPKAPLAVLAGILTLAIGAGVILVADALEKPTATAQAHEFQTLVGGLGFGPAVDLARCPNSFDPRLAHRCPADLGPIPGGGFFCPYHACSIFYYPPLEGGR
jgi:hypothetical protein